MSVLRGTGRQQLSASTFAVRQWTGSHVLRIHDFTQVMGMVYGGGVVMTSSTFAVGGENWRICCCPNGGYGPSEDYIALYLHARSNAPPHKKTIGDITAKPKFSILDKDLQPCYTQTTTRECDPFITHEDLLKNKYLNGDCLTVQCYTSMYISLFQ
jgi:hypothetical protein